MLCPVLVGEGHLSPPAFHSTTQAAYHRLPVRDVIFRTSFCKRSPAFATLVYIYRGLKENDWCENW